MPFVSTIISSWHFSIKGKVTLKCTSFCASQFSSVEYFDSNESTKTKTAGLFVAGDTRKKDVRQVSTAIGDGAVAATNACNYLNTL